MKKVKNIFSIIGLMLLVSLHFSITFSYTEQTQSYSKNLEPKVLVNLKREKLDSNKPQEAEIGDYVGNKNILLNDKAKELLNYFKIDFNEIKSVKVVKDNTFKNQL